MNRSLNVLVVEDELLISEMMREMLTDLGHTVVASARSYTEALAHLKQHPTINLALLDINLGTGKNGMDVAQEIKTNYRIPFLFLTSYADKKTIQEAIALKPEAYLIKPFSQPDLMATLEIVKARNAQHSFFTFKSGYQTVKLNTADILWLKTDNVYVEIKTLNKNYLLRSSLEKLLTELNDPNIVRAHRSYAVNLNHVNAVSNHHILIGQEKIPLARNSYDTFMARFK